MGQNFKDWRTTLAGFAVLAVMFGLGVLRVKHPELDGVIDNTETGINLLTGAGLIIGTRSGQ